MQYVYLCVLLALSKFGFRTTLCHDIAGNMFAPLLHLQFLFFFFILDPFHKLHLEVLGCGSAACTGDSWELCGGVMRWRTASFLSFILWYVSLHFRRLMNFSPLLTSLILFFLPNSRSSLYFSFSLFKYLSLLSGSASRRAR